MSNVNKHERGFALPAVIIIAGAMMIMLIAVLQNITSIRMLAMSNYYQQLAEEAAEAGTAYADACLQKNQRIQTWGGDSKPKLTEKTDCTGTVKFNSNQMILPDENIQTSFEVGDLDVVSGNQASVQIPSKGTVQLKSGSNIIKTYTAHMKKVIVWQGNVDAQRSVAGKWRTCGIVSGKAYCWGTNQFGQLGNGLAEIGSGGSENSPRVVYRNPVEVKREVGIMANTFVHEIYAGRYHNCALTSEGKVYCWGRNNYGQIGNGTYNNAPSSFNQNHNYYQNNAKKPVEVKGALDGKIVVAIGGSADTSCAVTSVADGGKIYCWGRNDEGQAGQNSTTARILTPTLVATNSTDGLPTNYVATKLSTSGALSFNTCAIANGQAYCWGSNATGAIGDNQTCGWSVPNYWGNKSYTGPCLRPMRVSTSGGLSGKTITAISQDGYNNDDTTGDYPHVCALTSDSQLYCWGDNSRGQIGINNTTDQFVPQRINHGELNGKQVKSMAVGLRHSCAADTTNNVYCWGNNDFGQLGTSNRTSRSIPTAVTKEAGRLLGQTIVSIGAAADRSCAVATNSIYCWGANNYGQVGNGDVTEPNVTKPVEAVFLRPNNIEYTY